MKLLRAFALSSVALLMTGSARAATVIKWDHPEGSYDQSFETDKDFSVSSVYSKDEVRVYSFGTYDESQGIGSRLTMNGVTSQDFNGSISLTRDFYWAVAGATATSITPLTTYFSGSSFSGSNPQIESKASASISVYDQKNNLIKQFGFENDGKSEDLPSLVASPGYEEYDIPLVGQAGVLKFDIKASTSLVGVVSPQTFDITALWNFTGPIPRKVGFELKDRPLSEGLVSESVPADPAVAAVPEPATWMMMIAGFGLIGATLRARRTGGLVARAA